MKLNIKATNFKLTPILRQYVEDKLGRDLEKYLEGIGFEAEAWIEVGKTSKHHHKGEVFRAEAQIKLPGKSTLRAEAQDVDIHIAIDRVRDKIARELRKYKGKRSAQYKRGARKAKKDLKLDPSARFYRKGRVREEGV